MAKLLSSYNDLAYFPERYDMNGYRMPPSEHDLIDFLRQRQMGPTEAMVLIESMMEVEALSDQILDPYQLQHELRRVRDKIIRVIGPNKRNRHHPQNKPAGPPECQHKDLMEEMFN